jgi:hypothetical protein
MGVLNDILDGFNNQSIMASTLHDPELPCSEVTAILSLLSGCMHANLEETIRSAMDVAKVKCDGHDFPAIRIKKVIDHYIQDHILSRRILYTMVLPYTPALSKEPTLKSFNRDGWKLSVILLATEWPLQPWSIAVLVGRVV